MKKLFSDYCWKNGRPIGKSQISLPLSDAYSIVSDPYYKRFTIEKFKNGKFQEIVYDSILLDFRHLREGNYQGWQRETISETSDTLTCILRNLDDRALLIERQQFQDGLCKYCQLCSIHGILIGEQTMHYISSGDSWNGVSLLDRDRRLVMRKVYNVHPKTGEFTDLQEEVWDFTK